MSCFYETVLYEQIKWW